MQKAKKRQIWQAFNQMQELNRAKNSKNNQFIFGAKKLLNLAKFVKKMQMIEGLYKIAQNRQSS